MQLYQVVAWIRYDRNFRCFAARWRFSHINISCVPKCYQSVWCCFIRYSIVRIRVAKCFTKAIKQFRREVVFRNEHTFCW
jgi:hypothetical protein